MGAITQPTLGPMELERVQDASRTIQNSVQDWLALFSRACGRAGIPHKGAASEMGISPQQLSTQLSGRDGEHVSFTRMRLLPPAFWRELLLLIAEYHEVALGSTVDDRADAELGRMVRDVVRRAGSR